MVPFSFSKKEGGLNPKFFVFKAAPEVVMDLPHMMFYGPPGAGKKTRVLAMLSHIFQGATEKVGIFVRFFA